MKQLLVIAIALVSSTAFASRARENSLGDSPYVLDTESLYSNPAKMFLLGDFANIESGKTATTTADQNAEGQVVRTYGDAKAGLSLGHKSLDASAQGLRQIMGAGIIEQQNPLGLSYGMKSGDVSWAGTLVYSNFNDKTNTKKESSGGVRFGALTGAWDMSLGVGLLNTAENQAANIKYKGTLGVTAYAGYTMENLYAYGNLNLGGAKLENDATGAEQLKVSVTDLTIGVVAPVKKDGNEFFYGVALSSLNHKFTASGVDQKETDLTLPIIVGLEAEATSWLTLRGSLTQTVLLDNTKNETGAATQTAPAGEFSPGGNNTVAAIGAGLKFNKITVDGNFSALTGGAASGNLDGNNLLTTVGVTYMF